MGQDETLLITGAAGYVGQHVTRAALAAGYRVRAGMRDPDRAAALQDAVGGQVEAVRLDLLADDGWVRACDGVAAVLHVASPVPTSQPADPEDVMRPAVDGTRRVLGAALTAGVGKVVLTSSIAAMTAGTRESRSFGPADWTDPDTPGLRGYSRAKTLAERLAWDVAGTSGLDLTVLNPAYVMGPPLDGRVSSSIGLIERLLAGTDLLLPRFCFPCVDARDVAEAHVRAIDRPAASGQRIPLCGGNLWASDLAALCREAVPGARIARRAAPDTLVRLIGLFQPMLRGLASELRREVVIDSSAMAHLGMTPRDPAQAVIDTARALAARNKP